MIETAHSPSGRHSHPPMVSEDRLAPGPYRGRLRCRVVTDPESHRQQ